MSDDPNHVLLLSDLTIHGAQREAANPASLARIYQQSLVGEDWEDDEYGGYRRRTTQLAIQNQAVARLKYTAARAMYEARPR